MSDLILGKFALEHLYYSTRPRGKKGTKICCPSKLLLFYCETVEIRCEAKVGVYQMTGFSQRIPRKREKSLSQETRIAP